MPVVRQRAMPSAAKETSIMDLLKVPAAKKQVSAKKKKKIKESLSSLSLLASAAASSRTGKHQLPYYDILPPKYRIQPTDIICGRKAVTFANKDSNVFYRELTEQCFLHYEAVDITQKARVSKAIFSTLKKRGYRFVSCDSFWDPDTIEVGYLMSDEKSIEKISQTMRDLRREQHPNLDVVDEILSNLKRPNKNNRVKKANPRKVKNLRKDPPRKQVVVLSMGRYFCRMNHDLQSMPAER